MPLVSDPTFGTGTQLVIDPSEVAVDRTEFALNEGDCKVAEGGPDWNQSAIVAAMAEGARGELPVDFRIPNRQITIPLLLGGTPSGADFDTQRRYLQAKVGLIQREGGWLKRQDPGKDPIYFDLVNASLTLPDQYSHLNVESGVVLTLDAIPDFYGDELELSDHSETTLPEIVFTETDIEGDYPGRLRLVVDNDSAADQLGLVACVRSRHYDPAATARLAYEAEDLTPLDTATVASLAGASGGEVVTHANLGTQWTPVLGTNLPAFSSGPEEFLTHKGSYRVRARVHTTSGVAVGRPPSLRFIWDVGDLAFPEENDPWAIPGANDFYIADLGEIRLDPAPIGDHRWEGRIQAKANGNPPPSGQDISIDRIWLEPLDEGHALLQAPVPSVSGSTGPAARDGFDQTAGALGGKTASAGGNWATAGDANDFAVVTSPPTAQRTAASDSGAGAMPGRFAVLGPALVSQAPQIDISRIGDPNISGSLAQGVAARYIDTDNYLLAAVDVMTGELAVTAVVAGSPTTLVSTLVGPFVQFYTYTLRLAVGPSGAFAVWLGTSFVQFESPVNALLVASGHHASLATGGALASGKGGFYDGNTTATILARIYDNFSIAVPTFDAVAFANQSAQLGTDGNFREDASGAAYGPVSIDSGDLLRIPPSGIEGRTVEFMVKASRGDFDQLPDSGIDDLSVQGFYRPSWLTMPW